MNRRQFVRAAAGAAALVRIPGARAAAKYDLIVQGGRVIDPARKLDAIRDVAIANGRIASIEAGIRADAVETIDARGKLVVPGLIDIHTHAARSKDGPPLCLADGVTGLIDAGSQGADRIEEVIAVAKSAPQQCRVLINIGRAGIVPEGDTMDLSRADVGAAREAIGRNREMIVGVKARLSRDVAGQNDFEVLRRAQEVASSFQLPVMIHMGQTMSPLPKLLALLKSGDIVTHMFAPPPNGILDDAGHILPEVMAARRRGVRFDLGNGRTGHLRWDIVERVMQAGFLPDTLSTDWTHGEPHRPGHRLAECHVEVLDAGHDARPGGGVRDRQCFPRIPGLPQPRHAKSWRAGRHCRAGTTGRGLRIRGQLREQTDGPAAAVPERHRARRQAGRKPRLDGPRQLKKE